MVHVQASGSRKAARMSTPPVWALWRDGRGRLSPWRIAILALLLWPAVLAVWTMATAGLGARPLNDLIHRSGYWAVIFIMATLAITPLGRIRGLAPLLDVRRILGVGAFAYAAGHFFLYVADQHFNLLTVASEIVRRLYLTVGFVALIGLAVLAATSTDGMVRRLGGRRWQRLHQLSYGIALLALVHFFQQTKLDVSVPTLFAGLFVWLMGYRLAAWRWWPRGQMPAWALLALALTVTILVFLVEAVVIGIVFGVSPLMVLGAAFDFEYDIRAGWLVLAAGLCVVALDLAGRMMRPAAAKASALRKPAATPR